MAAVPAPRHVRARGLLRGSQWIPMPQYCKSGGNGKLLLHDDALY